jgi:hypothetical protein
MTLSARARALLVLRVNSQLMGSSDSYMQDRSENGRKSGSRKNDRRPCEDAVTCTNPFIDSLLSLLGARDSIDCEDKGFFAAPGARHAVWPTEAWKPPTSWLETKLRADQKLTSSAELGTVCPWSCIRR